MRIPGSVAEASKKRRDAETDTRYANRGSGMKSNAQKTGIKDGSVAEASKKRRDAETDTRQAGRSSGASNAQKTGIRGFYSGRHPRGGKDAETETDTGHSKFYREELMASRKGTEIEINEQIRDREVRVIGADGQQLGIMSSRDAFRIARELDLDLVKIAATAAPPVVRITDYGKYRYEMLRKEKDARRNQRTTELKEIRMTPNIDTNDLNTKLAAARKFLEKGNKVKIALRFRGREMSRMNQSKYILDDFGQQLSDIAVLDKPAKVEGRNMAVVLSPKK